MLILYMRTDVGGNTATDANVGTNWLSVAGLLSFSRRGVG